MAAEIKLPFYTTAAGNFRYDPDGVNVGVVESTSALKYRGPDGTVRTVLNDTDTPTFTYSSTTRGVQVGKKVGISGASLHAGVLNWQNPESVSIVVLRAWLNVTTVATGACTVDVGVTATSATTASDTLLDGVDTHTAVALFDSGDASLDSGANAHAQLLASGKWVTIKEASGDATGMVADLYVQYVIV